MTNENITAGSAPAETANEAVIHPPRIKCRLTVDELSAVVDKVIDALPDNLQDEWLAELEDLIGFPPIPEEQEEVFRHAYWEAARVTIAGLVKYGLVAEPFIAHLEVVTGVDRTLFEACRKTGAMPPRSGRESGRLQ